MPALFLLLVSEKQICIFASATRCHNNTWLLSSFLSNTLRFFQCQVKAGASGLPLPVASWPAAPPSSGLEGRRGAPAAATISLGSAGTTQGWSRSPRLFFFFFGKRPGLEDWKVEARPCETESAAIKLANQSVLPLTESGLKNDFLSDRDFESLVGIRTFP